MYTVEENQKLVYFTMHKYFKYFIDDEDVHQMGLIGLWKACKTYDEAKGNFSTYAVMCIHNEIIKHLRKLQRTYASANTTPIDHNHLANMAFMQDPKDYFEELELEQAFGAFFNALIPSQKQLLQQLMQDKSRADIAREQGKSHQTIYKSTSIIKEKLKRYLNDNV